MHKKSAYNYITCRDCLIYRQLHLSKLSYPSNMTGGALAIQERPEIHKQAFLICSSHASSHVASLRGA